MDWKLIYSIARDVFLVGVVIYVWWSNREKVTARRFAALEKDVAQRVTAEALRSVDKEREANCAKHEERTQRMNEKIDRVDNELRHRPNHSDLARIHGRIDEVNGTMRELVGKVTQTGHQVNLILEEMLKR